VIGLTVSNDVFTLRYNIRRILHPSVSVVVGPDEVGFKPRNFLVLVDR